MNKYQKHKLFSLIIITVMLIMTQISCGPKPSKIAPNTPYNLTVETKSRGAVLYWQVIREKDTPISGYNIYLANSPKSKGELYNSAPYPGDTDGDITRESIELTRLENGQKYYVWINTVYTNGNSSKPSNRLTFTPLSMGRITISPNHTTKKSGFCLSLEKMTLARDFDNDFYIYSSSKKAGISSPSRLHPSLRKTLIKIDNDPKSKFSESQPLVKGETYTLRIADGGIGKLTLVKLTGSKLNRSVVFDYIYYPPGVEP